MPEMRWTVNVQVSGGTAVTAAANTQSPEAIDAIDVVLSPGDRDKVVDIQPGGAAAIQLMLIRSSVYGKDIRYKVSDGSTDSASIILDAPQVFSGGSVALFGLAPRQLKFGNTSSDKEATVRILVARDATP